MKPILNIENLTKIYGNVPSQTKGTEWDHLPGDAGRVSRHYGKQWFRQIHASQLYCNCDSAHRWKHSGGGRYSAIPQGKGSCRVPWQKDVIYSQNFELLDNLTGRENILLPTSLHGVSEAESSQRLKQLADYLEITDVLDKFPSKMSGGQRQRVAAARALILHPQMILADEPTGALDSKNARSLMEKLSGLNRDEQATILMVTHDSNAASFCKRILFIQDGVIFHELRRGDESQQEFYGRILKVMAQLGGGSANVL